MATLKYLCAILAALTLCDAASVMNYYMEDHCGSVLPLTPNITGQASSVRLRLTRRSTYHHPIDCKLTISTTQQNRLMFHFQSVDMPSSSVYCNKNFLQVYDGSTTGSRQIPGLTANICSFKSRGYSTSSKYLTLRFASTSTFLSNYRGFDMVITSYHVGTCYANELRCNNGRCIDKRLKCNGYNPCNDLSDCPGIVAAVTAGVIAGAVIGGIVFIGIVIVAIFFLKRVLN